MILAIPNSRRVMCVKCNKDFCNIYKARRHLKYVHATVNMSVSCHLCESVLKNKNTLQDHMREMHNVFSRGKRKENVLMEDFEFETISTD